MVTQTSPNVLTLNRVYQRGYLLTGLTTDVDPFAVNLASTRTDDGPVLAFKVLIRNCSSATSNLTGTKSSFVCQPGESRQVLTVFPYGTPANPYIRVRTGFSDLLQEPLSHPSISAFLANAVVSRAYARFAKSVREAQESISGPTFLGEFRELIAMFRRPMKKFNGLIEKYITRVSSRKGFRSRRTNHNVRKDVLDAAADSWLELSFGIKPLIGDVAAIAEGLARLLHSIRHTVVRGFAEDEFRTQLSGEKSSEGCIDTLKGSQTTKYMVLFRGGLHARLTDGPFTLADKAQRIFGFELHNFVPTVWELLPGSFLIDYISNIGDIIAAEATDFSDVAWCNMTTRTVTSGVKYIAVRSDPSWVPYGTFDCTTMGSMEFSHTTVSRSKADARRSMMQLEFSIPRKLNPYLNVLALLRSWQS